MERARTTCGATRGGLSDFMHTARCALRCFRIIIIIMQTQLQYGLVLDGLFLSNGLLNPHTYINVLPFSTP